MQPAYIYYTDRDDETKRAAPKSIFTQRSTIIKPDTWNRKFNSCHCLGCRESIKKNESNQAKNISVHTCQLKFEKRLDEASIAFNIKPTENAENERNQSQNSLNNNNSSLSKPFVVDSLASRQDIIPISKLPPGGLLNFGNLPNVENMYTGPSSVFLHKERLSKFASLLLLPNDMERLIEIDSTTTTRLQKYSNFICPCGYISDVMGKDNHQKECYLSITTDALRLSNYQTLMPKMCADIEIDKLPKFENVEKNKHRTNSNAGTCNIGKTIYFGVETGEKYGIITEHFADIIKHQKFKQKAYKCPFCNFWCIDILRFSTHISKHEPQKAFGCSACEYRSDRNFGVSRHIKLHKWKDVLHKDAVTLTGNALSQNHYAKFKICVIVINRLQQQNDQKT